MSTESTRRVLVIRGGAVGDFILTLPVLALLKGSIPGVQIDVMGNRGIVELATAAGHAERYLYLDTPGMALMFAKGATLPEPLRERFQSYNLILSYLYDPDGIFREQMQSAGARTFLDLPHRVEAGKGHAVEQLARPLERLAMFLPPGATPFVIKHQPQTTPRLAIHPGSGSIHKNWAVEHWARAGKQLTQQNPGMELALITGEAERERGVTSYLKEQWQDVPYLHWDALPLPELAEKLANCTHFLGHDSGISHLAAACGVPSHLFFGPTDPETWAPRGSTIFRPAEQRLDILSFDQGWQILVEHLSERSFKCS
jgi:heptosyltransferase III